MRNEMPKLEVKFNGNVYTAKNIKVFAEMSMDSTAFNLTLYKNDKKLADVTNDGWGGEDMFRVYQPNNLTREEQSDISNNVIYKLLDINDEIKFIKKHQRTSLCFKKPHKCRIGDEEFIDYTYCHIPIKVGNRLADIEELNKTLPTREVLNHTIQKYLKQGYIFINTNIDYKEI